ncbi:hypothetical protein ACO0LC_25740 [Undibacterium sp. JH2W]
MKISIEMQEFKENHQIFIWFFGGIWKIASEYFGIRQLGPAISHAAEESK